MYRNLFLVLFLFLNTVVYCNLPIVRNFSRSDYKSGTQNWAIEQNASNLMFFANNSGLLTFDGDKWNTYPILNRTSVRSILHSDSGLIYASTFNEFGYYKMQPDGTYLYFSLMNKLPSKLIGSNEIFNIFRGEGENVYFQSENSIYLYDGKTVNRLAFNYKIDVAAYVHKVLFVSSSEKGMFMSNGNMFVKIQGSEVLQYKRVCAIIPYKDNEILFVTSSHGVYVYNGITILPFDTGVDNFLKENQVFCAATNGAKLVFGTVRNGVVIQNTESKSTVYLNTFSGLQNNTILSVKFDNQQNLWLGLDNGIDYLVLNSPVSSIFGSNNLYGAGYTSIQYHDFVYFGTNQGLYIAPKATILHDIRPKVELLKEMQGQIWSLKVIDNTLFCGDDHGAFIIHPKKVERIDGLTGTWNFKQLRNNPDMILGCSYKGLFILKKSEGKWRFSHFLKGGFAESSPLFEEDSDGTIWFSHWQKGLFHLFLNETKDSIVKTVLFDERKGLPSIRNNTVFRVAGKLVFSSELGIFSYNKKLDKMEKNKEWNGLFSSTPIDMRLHESPSGDVWCLSGRFVGLARKKSGQSYEMDSLTYRMLQPKILIGFEHFNFFDNESLILANEDGFSRVDVRPKKAVNNTFKVLLNAVTAINSNDSVKERKVFVKTLKEDLQFRANCNNLKFDFNAPEYRDEGLVEYSYKLDNYDQNWSTFSVNSFKEYNRLPRGEYVFRVRARNMLDFREDETFVKFEILPAWYETKLAFGVYILILITIFISLIVFVNYRSGRGAAKMKLIKEKEMQEQKKIFDDETQAKKREIKELKNQQLQYELRHKSQELASSTMNLIRKNEILIDVVETITKTAEDIQRNTDKNVVLKRLANVERSSRQNIQSDDNWKKFEENFDLVYENYLKRLGTQFPDLNITDKKICAYIKMGLSSKDMSPLHNMSVRSIETNRYRIRKKMDMEREMNLSDFLQKF